MKNITELRERELLLIDTAINSGDSKKLFDLLRSIAANGDREMIAEFCVRLMVHSDLKDFIENPQDLKRVLVTDGWVAYENQSIDNNIQEFLDREGDLEYYFAEYAPWIKEII